MEVLYLETLYNHLVSKSFHQLSFKIAQNFKNVSTIVSFKTLPLNFLTAVSTTVFFKSLHPKISKTSKSFLKALLTIVSFKNSALNVFPLSTIASFKDSSLNPCSCGMYDNNVSGGVDVTLWR